MCVCACVLLRECACVATKLCALVKVADPACERVASRCFSCGVEMAFIVVIDSGGSGGRGSGLGVVLCAVRLLLLPNTGNGSLLLFGNGGRPFLFFCFLVSWFVCTYLSSLKFHFRFVIGFEPLSENLRFRGVPSFFFNFTPVGGVNQVTPAPCRPTTSPT